MHEVRRGHESLGAALVLLRLFAVRRMTADPWAVVLSLATVSCGVAILYATLMLGSSLDARYDSPAEVLGAASRIELLHAGGGAFDAGLRDRAAAVAAVRSAVPIVDRPALATLGARALRVTVVGADPAFAAAMLNGTTVDLGQGLGPQSAIVSPDVIGTDHSIQDAVLRLQAGDRQVRLRIGGVIRAPGHRSTTETRVVIVPMEIARWLFHMEGKVTSVLVSPRSDRSDLAAVDDLRRELRAAVGPSFLALPTTHRLQELKAAAATVQAFAAFASAVALTVGAYLLLNAMTLAMARERREIGVMIAIGESRRRLAARAMIMAAGLGVVGACFGLMGGYALGTLLVRLVPEVLQGASTGGLDVVLDAMDIALAGLMGPLACMAGAFRPAFAVMRLQPVEAMRPLSSNSQGRRPPGAVRLLAIAGAAVVIGAFAVRLNSGRIEFPVLAAGIFGAVATLPVVLAAALRSLARTLAGPWPTIRSDVRCIVGASVEEDPYRSVASMSAAALSIAAFVAIGAATLDIERSVGPFANALAGVDVYAASKDDPFLSVALRPEAIRAVAAMEGVAGVRELSSTFAWINESRVWIRGDDPSAYRDGSFVIHGLSRDGASRALREGGVLVSTQIAHRDGLRIGDRIELQTPDGQVSVPIAAVIESWSWPAGTVVMDSARFQALFGVGTSQLAITIRSGAVADDIARSIAAQTGMDAIPGAQLRERVLKEVRDQLAPFRLMQAALVAMIAVVVFDAMRLAVVQRRRQFGVLRAIGMSRSQLGLSVVLEAALLIAVAAVAGIALGVALQHVGVAYVANATGLPLHAGFHGGIVVAGCVAASAAAALGSAGPAFAAARLVVVEAIGYE